MRMLVINGKFERALKLAYGWRSLNCVSNFKINLPVAYFKQILTYVNALCEKCLFLETKFAISAIYYCCANCFI